MRLKQWRQKRSRCEVAKVRPEPYAVTAIQNFALIRENERLANIITARRLKNKSWLLRELRRGIFSLFGRSDGAQYSAVHDTAKEFAWFDWVTTSSSRSRKKWVLEWEKFVDSVGGDAYLLRIARPQKKVKRILILAGGGGLGDAILFAPLMDHLRKKLAPSEVVFLYPAKVGAQFYENSEVVKRCVTGDWRTLMQGFEAGYRAGLFDLVVFIRCFIPLFAMPAASKLSNKEKSWVKEQREAARLLERFSTNLGISVLDRIINVHLFDLLGQVTGLPIDANSSIPFTPNPHARKSVRRFKLPRNYVTVRDGANNLDMQFVKVRGLDRTTKQLSKKKWHEILSWLKRQNLQIVQVGDKNDPVLPFVSVDLRGKTNLSELYFVMKSAVTHIDTEGGLAHFARAANTPSVVFFPTTSASFFGYPGNVNISSAECNRCWYSTDEWLATCPRNTHGPVCVDTLNLEPMKKFVQARALMQRH